MSDTSASGRSPSLPLHIDSTMIAAFRSCPQKFFLEFCHGLRPARVSIDLHAGACFASTLEFIYQKVYQEKLDLSVTLTRAYGHFLEQWGDFEPMKDTPKTRERVWEAIEDYIRVYSPATDHVQPAKLDGSSFEFTFGIPLDPSRNADQGDVLDAATLNDPGVFPLHPSGSPFIYCGRFDLLGRMGSKLVIRDEKTTTSIGAAWSEQWDLRSQFMGYVWACQQSGLDIDTVVVRGVGILKTKITQVEAIKSYPRHLVSRWFEQLRRDLWRMRRMWDESYFDYNLADACSSYGGCAFRDVCISPSPERWFSNYVVRRWNPLNKNPIVEEGSLQ